MLLHTSVGWLDTHCEQLTGMCIPDATDASLHSLFDVSEAAAE
jgi:hypothetical protein